MRSYNGFSPSQRNRAQAWLRVEWVTGRLARPHTCHACGQTDGIIDAHAEDYSEPFQAGKTDEYHLCFTCHMIVHCRFNNRLAWDRYRDMIRRGFRFMPAYTRNFGRFTADHLDKGLFIPKHIVGPKPTRLVLDEIDQRATRKLTAPARMTSR